MLFRKYPNSNRKQSLHELKRIPVKTSLWTFNTRGIVDQESEQREMEKRLHEARPSGTRFNPAVNEIHLSLEQREEPEKVPWIAAARQAHSFVMQSTETANER